MTELGDPPAEVDGIRIAKNDRRWNSVQFRRVPPYYDHWLLHYPGLYEHSYDPTHLNSSLTSLSSVAKF